MKKGLFLLGMSSMLALTGCHGISKVDYAKFKEKADAAIEKAPEVKAVKISGKYDGEKVKVTYEIPQTIGAGIDSLISGLSGKYTSAESYAIGVAISYKLPSAFYTLNGEGEEGVTYFTGAGFKVKDEKRTFEWGGNALLASAKSDKASLSFSWVKK